MVDSGILAPGLSATQPGSLTVADTYSEQSTGTLDMQINGTAASHLKVSKAATLGGTLNIALGSGSRPPWARPSPFSPPRR